MAARNGINQAAKGESPEGQSVIDLGVPCDCNVISIFARCEAALENILFSCANKTPLRELFIGCRHETARSPFNEKLQVAPRIKSLTHQGAFSLASGGLSLKANNHENGPFSYRGWRENL